MEIRDLGIISYGDALTLQEQLAAEVHAERRGETFLLLEHHPVYTIGRGGDAGNILDPSVAAVRINRGGDVTYHGPGQLVGYPIIRLGRRGKDLRHYLRFLEEVLIRTVTNLGGEAFRVPGKTGVWSAGGKVASIGVGVRHWVSMHGFAINVNNDLSAFRSINPCGIPACPVASVAEVCGRPVTVAEVKSHVIAQFRNLLGGWLPEQQEIEQEVPLLAVSR
ncbi:lipoyl(octanoyl) transferase LipB [Geomonas sp. RF6]|uniref:lipoyl(octanoyl) transferase LipB n=1 Tax=Geomonas sp. RF6 TaxID=2897342 RepID=UPI001E64B2D5|nr:lipoyl(octanoyl) transferase LipB [Geomonas sp. RF6]UFS70668.1 lipoyl(octanoyl) transferase LipB [Geomonas sp. RF6]